MVLLAESLSTLSRAAPILAASLSLCVREGKEGERKRENSSFTLLSHSDRRKSLWTMRLAVVSQQVGGKKPDFLHIESFIGPLTAVQQVRAGSVLCAEKQVHKLEFGQKKRTE